MGWVVNATPRPLYPRERPGTHCIGSWASQPLYTGAGNHYKKLKFKLKADLRQLRYSGDMSTTHKRTDGEKQIMSNPNF
jgi:hypothetical protein